MRCTGQTNLIHRGPPSHPRHPKDLLLACTPWWPAEPCPKGTKGTQSLDGYIVNVFNVWLCILYKKNTTEQQVWLTCVLEPSVLTNCTWRLQIRPVMKKHLNSWRLYLGWSIRYYIQEVLNTVNNNFRWLSFANMVIFWKDIRIIQDNTTFHTSCLYFIRHSNSWQWYTNISIKTPDQLTFLFLSLLVKQILQNIGNIYKVFTWVWGILHSNH